MDFSVHIVRYYKDTINTTVTASASIVDEWIDVTIHIANTEFSTKDLHIANTEFSTKDLFVGLDTKVKLPSDDGEQPVVIAQLCFGRRCLIYQLCHTSTIPTSFRNFLESKKFTFVGKEVKNNAYKLAKDFGLKVGKFDDVSMMAAEKYNEKYKNYDLKMLAYEFLDTQMEKREEITMSKWDGLKLSDGQIEYAAVDAFVSLRLAKELKKPIYEY